MESIIRKYRWYILLPLLICAIVTGLVVLLGAGPQQGAFKYQIF